MLQRRENWLSGSRVPELGGSVPGPRHDDPAIGAESYILDATSMPKYEPELIVIRTHKVLSPPPESFAVSQSHRLKIAQKTLIPFPSQGKPQAPLLPKSLHQAGGP